MKKMFTSCILSMMLFIAGNAFAAPLQYCSEKVTHLNIEAETNSAIFLTISKIDATSFYVEIESATEDNPVDFLLVNGTGATVSEADNSVEGKIRRTFTYEVGSSPDEVTMEILWSKESTGGNWMLNSFTIPFPLDCSAPVEEDNEKPTDFTAEIGEIYYNKVEILLQANDNSGFVTYEITFDGTTNSTTGVSGKEISYTVKGLQELSNYSFSVIAKDASDNQAENNPIVLETVTAAIPTSSDYCGKSVKHLNNDAENNSEILLTISNINANTFYVEIESATEGDPVDFLLVNGTSATVSEADNSVEGKIRRTFTYEVGTSPDEVTMQILWSKESTGGNWMINSISVPFLASCSGIGTSILTNESEQLEVFAYPNPVESFVYINIGELSFNNLSLYNTAGQLVISKAIDLEDSQIELNVEGLKAGVYIIQLEGVSKNETIRVIKK